jgi:ABC-type multidrug transport system fused ATPase/permease subunit
MHSGRDFSRSPLAVFLTYYRPHRALLTFDILMALVGVAAELAFPYATRFAIQTLLPRQDYPGFFRLMAVLAAAYALRAFTTYLVTRSRPRTTVKMSRYRRWYSNRRPSSAEEVTSNRVTKRSSPSISRRSVPTEERYSGVSSSSARSSRGWTPR